jgi:streptogramin lyase
VHPIKLVGDDSPVQSDYVSFPSGDGAAITDVAISPEGTKHVYLTDSSDTVWQVDSLTGRSAPLATVSRPEKLVYGGPEQRLFVLTADQLVALGRDGSRLNVRAAPGSARRDRV